MSGGEVKENINAEENLEKILNLELAPYVPDWIKPYLTKHGTSKGESLSRKEREELAEKVWNELQKNWDKIMELLDAKNASILPTTVLALIDKFPSEYRGSKKKVINVPGEVIEQTTRSALSNIFERLRANYLAPLKESFAPIDVLDMNVLKPMTPDQFELYLKELSDIIQLYRYAYLVFSFVNSFNDKKYEEVRTADLKEADPEKLKYIQDLVNAHKKLNAVGIYIPPIVDKNNRLLAGSLKDLSPNGTHVVLKLNDLDLDNASEGQLKKLKSLLDFAKKAFDNQYGAMIVKVDINPSTLDMQVFKTIVKLLGICPDDENSDACLYNARQYLSAFPESLKDKFIDNFATEAGRNPKYRIEFINQFATLFALVNYYNYINELKRQELMHKGVRNLRQEEEEKARNILNTLKRSFRIS